MMNDLISRQAVFDIVDDLRDQMTVEGYCAMVERVKALPSAEPDFNITVKIDKAYDDGYEAGYLQGRHDWGDLDG